MEKNVYDIIVGAFSVPGKNPGSITIAGIEMKKRDIHVLEDFQSEATHKLVKQMFVLEDEHRPKEWFGDSQNQTARYLLDDLNKERSGLGLDKFCLERRGIYLSRPSILDMLEPYQRIWGMIEPLLTHDTKRLFLNDSGVKNHISDVKEGELSFMAWGEYPDIEALGIVVIELTNWEQGRIDDLMNPPLPEQDFDPMHFAANGIPTRA